MKVPCSICGEAKLDPAKPGAYREVRGWEEVRRGGGAHAITLREETGRVCCQRCMSNRKAGIASGQEAML